MRGWGARLPDRCAKSSRARRAKPDATRPDNGSVATAMVELVEIRELPEILVAYMRYVGPYGSPAISDMWRRFESWCASQGFMSAQRRMFGVAQDNPNITPRNQTRYDACIEVDAAFQPTGDVGAQSLRGGRYACVPFTGTAGDVQAAWIRFLTRTLPRAGYRPDLSPAFELYDPGFFVDPGTGVFSCSLCVPVLRSPT